MHASDSAVKETPLPSARQTPFKGARLALILLLTINLFNYLDRYVLAAVLGPVGDAFLSPDNPHHEALLGLLTTAFIWSYMVLGLVFGWLADRWSRWKLVGIGVICWSLASGASGLASTYLILLLTRCFVGVGEAAYGPVAPAMISDLYPERIRGRVLSWFYMAIPVGSALGYVWGTVVAGPTFGLDWRWAFYLVVPPGLLLGLWCFFMREPQRGQADAGTKVPHHRLSWRDYRLLLHIPSYVLNTLGMTAMTFAIGGISALMPHYLVDFRHEPDSAKGIFGIIVAVSGLIATLLGGITGDWLRPRFPGSYFLVSGVAMFVAFPFFLASLYAPFHPFPWAWIFIFLACFFLFFNTGPTNTILANVTHPAMRATAFAVNIFVLHLLGDAISPTIIGGINDLTLRDGVRNMNVGFLAVSGMILVGGVFWLWGTRYLKADTERAPLLFEEAPR
ncbi:MAG TPA: MFS transporter [Gemmataceae bacterium]|nr:MFS transporter [Gemmataceae bacterium]